MIAPNLGSEFIPKLSEGALAINVVRLAGADLDAKHLEQRRPRLDRRRVEGQSPAQGLLRRPAP